MKTKKQRPLAIIAKIKEGQHHIDELEDLFEEIVHTDIQDEKDPPDAIVPFKRLKTIHFARWMILPEGKDLKGRTIPPRLAFSSNYDAPLDGHLEELVDEAGESGLDRIYEHCVGYPEPGSRTRESRLAYLRAHQVKTNTFYVGTRGRTVQQIRDEATLHDAIQEFVDRHIASQPWAREDTPQTRSKIREMIKEYVSKNANLRWAMKAPTPWTSGFVRFLHSFGKWIGLALAAVLIVLFVLGLLHAAGLIALSEGLASEAAIVVEIILILALIVALFFLILLLHEIRDKSLDLGYPCTEISELTKVEDRVVQNQMTSVVNIKGGWFRGFTIRLVLWVIHLFAQIVYTKGQLAGIPSIHFARWIIADEGRSLVFLSNFDGSWENYLGDFIDKAASGLTAVWSNTYGFPKTRFLMFLGARDEQRFKAFTRASQTRTNVWYSAYKTLTVQNVNNNSKLRAGLQDPMSDAQTAEWLRLI